MPWWQLQDLMVTSAVTLGGLILVAGVTVRFFVKPFLKDYRELKGGGSPATPHDADRRLERMELQLEQLELSMNRLLEVTEFDRQLKSGKPPEGNP